MIKRKNIIKVIAAIVVAANVISFQGGQSIITAFATVELSDESTASQEAKDAKTAIDAAEANPTQANISAADTALSSVDPADVDLEVLTNALAAIKAAEAGKLTDANTAVETAESAKTQESVDAAQAAVDKLASDVTEKTALQSRIEAVKTAIAEAEKAANLEAATSAVEKAEADKTDAAVAAAQAAVDKLAEDVTEKATLQSRIDAVKDEIVASQKENLTKAQEAVDKLVSEKTLENVAAAETALDALSDSVPEKAKLQMTVVAIKTGLQAEAAVKTAETDKTEASVTEAQAIIDKLDEGTDKEALQARLDKVKADIDAVKADIEAATSAVEKAEADKTTESIELAKVAIGKLADTLVEKVDFQVRINTLINSIEFKVDDLNTTDVSTNYNYGFDATATDNKASIGTGIIDAFKGNGTGSIKFTYNDSIIKMPFNALSSSDLTDAKGLTLKSGISNLDVKSSVKLGKQVYFELSVEKNDGTTGSIHSFLAPVQISIPFTAEDIKDIDISKLTVYYIKADGTLEEMKDSKVEGNFITFTTSHFSSYVLGEKEEAIQTTPEDKKAEETKTTKTSDNTSIIGLSLIASIATLIGGITFISLKRKKREGIK